MKFVFFFFGFMALLLAPLARAQDVVVLDFPVQATAGNLPAGLVSWPEQKDGRIQIPLLPLDEEGAMLVAIMFQDGPEGSLRAFWRGEDGSLTPIQDELAEQVQGWNLGNLKVPFTLLQGGGTLILEPSSSVEVRRVSLSWLWPTDVFMGSSAQAVEMVPNSRRVLTTVDFQRPTSGEVPDTWAAGIWKASLQNSVESLNEGIEFSVPMESVPQAVVFQGEIMGVAFDQPLEIWVNGQPLSATAVEVPSLGTAGYLEDEDGRLKFAGWREVRAVIPRDKLLAGENSIVLASVVSGYIRRAALELSFESEGAPLRVGQPEGAIPSIQFPPSF